MQADSIVTMPLLPSTVMVAPSGMLDRVGDLHRGEAVLITASEITVDGGFSVI